MTIPNPLRIIGISVLTTNENEQAAKDLNELWKRFFEENLSGKISNKISEDVYTIYTDYTSDHTGSYRAIIGFPVDSLDEIPAGCIGRVFPKEAKYAEVIAKGEMPMAVVKAWTDIWEKDEELNRKYTADFEVYGENSSPSHGKNAEVHIYLAVE